MKKNSFKIGLGLALMFSGVAGAGTSVGNFRRLFQKEFDFEVRHPDTWVLTTVSGTSSEGTAETWELTNSPAVPEPETQSKIEFAFLREFPAKNQNELLQEIQRRHPKLVWNAVKNPDFTGFRSMPIEAPRATLVNMEYYLTEAKKAVRIDIHRNAAKNGAAESEVILSTIRKPSLPMFVESVTYDKNSYQVGDRACIFVKVDALKANGEPSLTLGLTGELKHWLFRDRKFDEESGTFKICQTLTRAMPSQGLFIETLNINNGTSPVSCHRQSERLLCKAAKLERLSNSIQEPVFKNESVDSEGPQVLRFVATADQKGFVVDVSDPAGVAFAQIDFQESGSTTKKQMILFEDELKDPQHVYEVPKSVLAPGFNLVRQVTLFDKVGNVTMLSASDASQKVYKLVYAKKNSEPSRIPYVSIRKY
jgi:hypothetical protein